MDRRDFLRLSALGLAVPALAACGDDKPDATPTPTPTGPPALEDLGVGHAPDIQVGPAQEEVLVGERRYIFGIRQGDGTALTNAKVTVHAGRDETKPAEIVQDAVWFQEGVQTLGIYGVPIAFPAEGDWRMAILATADDGSKHVAGIAQKVVATSTSPIKGGRMTSVATPTRANPGGAGTKNLCSDPQRPCSMHEISLDAALKNGKPTVITFSAPGFCRTQVCGPVVSVVEAVATANAGKANFIHVEAYWDDKTKIAPPLEAFRFQSEPWTYFIGADGTVRDRLSGAVAGEEVRTRTAALLA